MRWVLIIFSIIFLAVSSKILVASQEFSLSTNLQPLKLSYNDIYATVEKISGFLKISNGYDPNKPDPAALRLFTNSLTITAGESTILVNDDLQNINFSKYPEIAYELRYDYYDSRPSNSITQVSIDLRDYSRTIKIAGNKPDQVEALFVMLKNDLGKHRVLFSGPTFRTWLLIFVVTLIWLPAWFFTAPSSPFFKTGRFALLGMWCSLVGIVLCLSIFFVPYPKFFSGFAVFTGEASWVKRFAAEISFYGLSLTVIFLPTIGWFINLFRKKK